MTPTSTTNFLVTGATSGLGLELVRKLLERRKDARVVLGVRNVELAREQLDALDADQASRCEVGPALDLGDFQSIRAFARVVNDSAEPLHVLVNNAGMNKGREGARETGWPEIITVNYLGPFLLTLLLEPKLLRHATDTSVSRVVNVSSIMHRFSTLAQGIALLDRDRSDTTVIDAFMRPETEGSQLGDDEAVSTSRLYSDTKLGNALFTVWLNTRWQQRSKDGSRLRAVSVDPGGVVTGIWRNSRWENSRLLDQVFAPARDGAEALYDCCVGPLSELSEPLTSADFHARGAFKSSLLHYGPDSKRLALAATLVAAVDWPIRKLSLGRLASKTEAVRAAAACYDTNIVSALGDATETFLANRGLLE